MPTPNRYFWKGSKSTELYKNEMTSIEKEGKAMNLLKMIFTIEIDKDIPIEEIVTKINTIYIETADDTLDKKTIL